MTPTDWAALVNDLGVVADRSLTVATTGGHYLGGVVDLALSDHKLLCLRSSGPTYPLFHLIAWEAIVAITVEEL